MNKFRVLFTVVYIERILPLFAAAICGWVIGTGADSHPSGRMRDLVTAIGCFLVLVSVLISISRRHIKSS